MHHLLHKANKPLSAPALEGLRSCWHPQRLPIAQHTSRILLHTAMAGKSGSGGRIVTDDQEVQDIAANAKRVGVLGIKTEQQAEQPAFRVPSYLADMGVDVVPIPVYYPDVTSILGNSVYRSVAAVPPPRLDVLNIFRRPSDLMAHLPDILAAKELPTCVWLQSGITHAEFERALVDAGCLVVADRCIMVEHAKAQSRQWHQSKPTSSL